MMRLLLGVDLSRRELASAALLGLGSALITLSDQLLKYASLGFDMKPGLRLSSFEIPTWVILGIGLGVLIVPIVKIALYAQLARRLEGWKVGYAVLGAVIATVLGLWIATLIAPESAILHSCLNVWRSALIPLLYVTWWAIATDLYDVSDGERVLSVAVVFHTIFWVGSRFVPFFVGFGENAMFLASAAAYLGVLGCFVCLRAQHPGSAPPPGSDGPGVARFLLSRFAVVLLVVLALEKLATDLSTRAVEDSWLRWEDSAAFVDWHVSLSLWMVGVTVVTTILFFPRVVRWLGSVGTVLIGLAVMTGALMALMIPNEVGAMAGLIVADVAASFALLGVGLLWLRTTRSARFGGRVALTTLVLILGRILSAFFLQLPEITSVEFSTHAYVAAGAAAFAFLVAFGAKGRLERP